MMMASRAEGFGAEVKRRIMLGTFALSAGYADQYYNKALQVRRMIRGDFDAAFQEVDVLLGPTSPTPAFKLGERTADPLAMYLSDIYTITANLAGIPGISIPCGLTKDNLPIGLQLLAAPFAEETLLRTARVFERETDWHQKRPGLRADLQICADSDDRGHDSSRSEQSWTTKSSSAWKSTCSSRPRARCSRGAAPTSACRRTRRPTRSRSACRARCR